VKAEIHDQLKECLTSDLVEEAKIIWIYLKTINPQGASVRTLATRLQMEEDRAQIALEALEERGIAKFCFRRFGEVWIAQPIPVFRPTRNSTSEYHEKTCARQMLTRYNQRREQAGFRAAIQLDTQIRYFAKLYKMLEELEVNFDAWMDFAIERTEFMKAKMPFPTPMILSGNWLKSEWCTNGGAGTTKPKTPEHAGAEYSDPAEVKQLLASNGFDRAKSMTKAELRYVDGIASSFARFPQLIEPDPDWIAEITFLSERYKDADRT